MAFIVARPNHTWELRESHTTAAGPRGRTLATFRTLTPEVLARARVRSSAPLTEQDLRRAALRAGAPVAAETANRASAELLGELARGAAPRPVLSKLLRAALLPDDAGTSRVPRISDGAREAGRWTAASAQQRGEALHDLLLLVDALPPRRESDGPAFPVLRSRPR
jgi:hypothetical protein